MDRLLASATKSSLLNFPVGAHPTASGKNKPEVVGHCCMIEEIIDERVHRIADAAGVSLSTPVATQELHAVWKMTGAPVAEARLLMQIVGAARCSPTLARAILYDLDALVLSRPELEVIRALCVGGQR